MNFSTFSAQTINFVDDVMEFDYQQLWINLMTIGAICAVIIGAAYQQLRRVKFSTPHQIGDKFYFGLNLTRNCDNNDERMGVSFGAYYAGVYGNQLVWGKVNENGALWFFIVTVPILNIHLLLRIGGRRKVSLTKRTVSVRN